MNEISWSRDGLHGSLITGGDLSPGPAVLIIAGSDPTDRNGNGPRIATDTYRLLALGLAASGIRSLRYDKRGVGKSVTPPVRESDLTFERLIEDAETAARDLSARRDITHVILVGNSEGALVALEAAAKTSVAGIVLLAAAGRPLAALLREQLGNLPMPDELRAQALSILDTLASHRPVDSVPAELQPLFRPSVQPFLMSEMKRDPAAMLASLSVPVLLIQGERDLQVSRSDFDTLRQARPDARSVLLSQANHILKPAPADRAGNIATYAQPDLPLDPGVLPAIVEFVLANAAPTAPRPSGASAHRP